MASQVEADLPPGLSCLKNVDTLLRCPICFDFLNISMMTKCSHNFCSLCIRKFFSYKLQCPVCNTQATEQDLRNNRVLDELVVGFQAARQQLSKVNFESPPISPKTPAAPLKCKTPRDKGQKSNSVLSNYFQKKSKTSPDNDARPDSSVSRCGQRGKRQNLNKTLLHSASAQTTVTVKAEPVDAEEAAVQGLVSIKQEDAVSYSIDAAAEAAPTASQSTDVKPVIKVECPVCSVSVSQQFINKHLDTCLSSGEKKESLRSSFGSRRRPMAKLVYNLLSMQELKRRLKECHLSMQGSREQLVKRHQDFVHIYNAQCDSLNPMSAEDIAREVEANEKIRSQLQGKAKPVMLFSKNQSEEEIDEMHSNYRRQHSSDFSRLIAQVRGRLETSRQTRIKQEDILEQGAARRTCSEGQDEESKNILVIKVEDEDSDEEPSMKQIELSSSPTYSEVSVSSSISDIFGPDQDENPKIAERTSGQKRASSSGGDAATSSPASGKRRRKT
ncbi:E3 ubiquitin-protein ligase RAD18 [Betta splendens]|uniref:RING-type E3 ubiquitin transferase n=1 Tax=Betta splendens TaxID=158456 RepID=A0A6P7MLT1_BETSP|nr:E3 ubiquitin-protein ligase RAD18 [Betta splendens]